jgi:hypothetical protein
MSLKRNIHQAKRAAQDSAIRGSLPDVLTPGMAGGENVKATPSGDFPVGDSGPL